MTRKIAIYIRWQSKTVVGANNIVAAGELKFCKAYS